MTGLRPLLALIPHFRPHHRRLAVCFVLLLASSLLSLVAPALVAHAIDVDIATGDKAGLLRTAGVYVAVLVANIGVSWVGRVGLEVAAQGAMAGLKREVFDHLVDHDLAFFDTHTSGRLITRVQGDADALRVLFAEVILSAPADVLLVVGMITVLGIQAPGLVGIVVGVLPFYALAMWAFRKVAPPRYLAVRAAQSKLTGFLSEHVRAMPMLIGYDRTAWSRARSEDLNAEVYALRIRSEWVPVVYFNAVFCVRGLGIVAVLGWGAVQVRAGTLTLGDLMLGLGYLRLLFHPLMRLSHQLDTLERARAAARRLRDILDWAPTVVDRPDAVPWPGLNQGLALRGVEFAYGSAPDAQVIRGIDLEVPAGAHVGVVGPTGGGKTTLINLLLRFRDPTAGGITVDGVDLRDVRLADLRLHTGLVLQDVHLLAGTVADNLGGTRAEAQAALDTVGLDVSLDASIAEDGGNLSRGERQLLTFARALVDDPALLVLDEATSAVDPETEARVQQALDQLQRGRTTVTIAHRLHTIRHCDPILVLDAGRIVERGSHDELLAADGLYASLHALQEVDAEAVA